MPIGGQIAALAGIAVPTLVASGLAIGGYHNRPLALVCFIVAGIVAVVACLYVPLRRLWWRIIGDTPLRAGHKLIGTGALLSIDLGTEPSITDLLCEVHIPHYEHVGGQPSATATLAHALARNRHVSFIFPDDFGVAPVFKQVRCVGWYHVRWIVTQFDEPRVVKDKFHIRKSGFVAAVRLAWQTRKE